MNEERHMKIMKMPEAKVTKCTVMIKKKKERPAINVHGAENRSDWIFTCSRHLTRSTREIALKVNRCSLGD